MEQYTNIVTKMHETNELKNEIRTIVKESNNAYLNLSHPEWLQHLKNDAVYQRHLEGKASFDAVKQHRYVETQYLRDASDEMKVIVIAQCTFVKAEKKFDKSTGADYDAKAFISAKNCPPLEEICKAYQTGIRKRLKLSPYSKFFLENCCGPAACDYCYDATKRFKSYKDVRPWMCVSTTKLYTRERVRNIMPEVALEILKSGPFWAILRVDVSCRQFYGDGNENLKLSGKLREIVISKESFLTTGSQKKMKFLDEEFETTHLSSPSTSGRPTVENVEETRGEDAPQYSYSRIPPPPGYADDSETEDAAATQEEEEEETERTVCLPPRVANAYVEENEQSETAYEVVHYKKMTM